jgi:hypothetical protein
MHPEGAFSSGILPPEGLPPVKPPSGKFIAQLFVVPLLIVIGILGLFFAMRGLFGFGSPRTAEQYLQNLDQTNADVRWRAAQDLAQVLLRDDQLASNPKFALDLADRLRQTLVDSASREKALADLTAKLPATPSEEDNKAVAKATNELEASRKYAVYLGASLGCFTLPVGLPILKEMALKESGQEPKALALRRRQAVWSLANLGMNLSRFDNLSEVEQEIALETLQIEAASTGERGKWAKIALEWMQDRRAGKQRGLGEDFLSLSDADDPVLRQMTAHALNFWEGSAEESARIEEMLLRLSYDSGKGEELVAWLADDAEEVTHGFTRKPGAEVRYNAAVALARRGSEQCRLSLLEEMLDEESLKEIFRRTVKDGQETADEGKVWLTITSALKAVAELHRKNPHLDLAKLRPSIDLLAEHPNPSLRTEAKTTQNILNLTD